MPDDPLPDYALAYPVAFLLAYYASIFLHELGHALMCRRSGFVLTSFGMGVARPFWVGRWLGARVYLGRTRPFQGLTFFWMPQLIPSRRQYLRVLAGGILAHILLTAAALMLSRIVPGWWGNFGAMVAALNGTLALINAMPLTIRIGGTTFANDGAQILGYCRTGAAPSTSPMASSRLVAALRPLLLSIGDTTSLSVYLLGAAASSAELGDVGQAGRFLAEAEALLPDPPPVLRALAATVRAVVACAAGELDAAGAALDAAERDFRTSAHDAGLYFVAAARADLRLRRGDAPGASVDLDALAALPIVADRPAIRTALLVSRLVARAAMPRGDGVDGLATEYRAARRRAPSATRDFRVAAALADHFAGREDWERTVPACRDALRALRDLDDDLPDAAEHARFLQIHAGPIAAIRDTFRRAGRPEEADGVDDAFPDPETRARRRAEARGMCDRRRLRLGWRMTLGNVLLIPILAAVVRLSALDGGPRWDIKGALMVWSVLIGFYAAVAVLWGGVALILGRPIPALWRGIGLVTLILAACPWLSLLFLLGLMTRSR